MEWSNSNMDMDLFMKTYAANVILGMWDDYWTNMNNYYFYFDKKGLDIYFRYLSSNSCTDIGLAK